MYIYIVLYDVNQQGLLCPRRLDAVEVRAGPRPLAQRRELRSLVRRGPAMHSDVKRLGRCAKADG